MSNRTMDAEEIEAIPMPGTVPGGPNAVTPADAAGVTHSLRGGPQGYNAIPANEPPSPLSSKSSRRGGAGAEEGKGGGELPLSRSAKEKDEELAKKEEEEEDAGTASMREVFSLADRTDILLMVFGSIGAAVNGATQPVMVVLLGSAFEELSGGDLLEQVADVSVLFVLLAIVAHVTASIQLGCWNAAGKRQAQKLRESWFRAVMRQDVAWFDVNNPGEMPGRIASSIVTFEDGISRKLGDLIQFSITFAAGLALAFVYNAYVALVVIGLMPLLAASGALLIKVNTDAEETTQSAYAKAGAVAYEVIASLRTVLSFNGTRVMKERYYRQTLAAETEGAKRAFRLGVANGGMLGSFVLMYMVITFFGSWLIWSEVENDGCDPSNSVDGGGECELAGVEVNGTSIFVAMLCVAFGGQALGQIATSLQAFTAAQRAIKPGIDVINRRPVIDSQSDEGLKPESVEGRIVVDAVDFAYPSRPDLQVAKGYSLVLEPGTTTALVGESGSGKSTIVGLIQRFYDPAGGRIQLDGNDLRELNVRWLRDQMALVGQEPRLFSGTIAENIAHGAHGRDVSRKEIEDAAGLANAHEFIARLPKGYETQVGHGGSQLSGGQKQRIAIARALVGDPSILLLDEATSALDNKSERVVQDALDRLLDHKRRTTVVIAHRLSTIRNADKIAVVRDGAIAEIGTHNELMKSDLGLYRALVEFQMQSEEDAEALHKDGGRPQASAAADEDVDIGPAKDPSEAAADEESPLAGDKDKAEAEEEATEENYQVPFSRIMNLNKPEAKFLLVGAVGALLAGAVFPGWGILFAYMIELFYTAVFPCDDSLSTAECDAYLKDEAQAIRDDAILLGCVWLVVLAATIIGNILMFYGFGVASDRLSRRIRDMMFDKMLQQEPGYFDMPENSVGAVTSRLASDATLIKAKTGEPLQQVVMVLFSIGAGVVVALVYCWPLALMSLATLPIMGYATTLQMSIMLGTGDKAGSGSAAAGAVVGETISAVRTVASLGLEKVLVARYSALSHNALDNLGWNMFKQGNAFGLSVSVQFLNNALLFYWGAWLIVNMDFTFQEFLVSMFALLFGIFGLGGASQNATGAEEARRAFNNVFRLLDRESKINPEAESGARPEESVGGLELSHVNFTYPSRPDQMVCQDYSLAIKPGMTVGLVGPSGSGKSTAIQLLERFYDPDAGAVTYDGAPLPDLNYQWHHGQIGFVGQEPVLFSGTVKQNIAMGAGERDVSEDDVIAAAKRANAHHFIATFPELYDTDIGDNGDRLSGGQKQRVAIARALVKQPKVLLLDEATSALDSESEKIVQEALDKLIKETGLTTVMIAHRLSTIRDCDMICVVNSGSIAEAGTHGDLMAQKGMYFDLVNASE